MAYLLSTPMAFVYMIGGVLMGIIFGCIPGLTAVLGVTLMIPFTYAMAPAEGLSTLIGIYVGGISGGLITATLLKIPGTASSIVTCWDGYPMTKQGKPESAISLGVFASLIGGTFSAVVLIFVAPQMSRITLSFGSWEYFSLIILSMAVVVSMVSADGLRGIISCLLGLTLGCVGIDSLTGMSRLTFNNWQLSAGIALTPLLMGLFAVCEIFVQLGDLSGKTTRTKIGRVPFIPPKEDLKGTFKALSVGSVIGTFIGILPGIGQNAATVMAYNQAKNISKNPERFGSGSPEGICASESSNNAVNGGALVPLCTLGIPGDTVTAALIGGLMIHGLQPGPMLIKDAPEVIGCIMVVYFLANIAMFIMETGLMSGFVQLVRIRKSFLFPAILACCILGTYGINNRMFEVVIMIAFGIIGYLLTVVFQLDMVPILLGFILGPLMEKYLRTAVIASKGDLSQIMGHPIALVCLAIAIAVLVVQFIFKRKKRIDA